MKSVAMLAFGLALGAEERLGPPPLGLDLLLRAPESNPMQRGKVELGRRLFFDKNLSRDGTLACAGCHDPKLAFSDGRVVARGIHGVDGTRNSPALINRGYGESFFWDGRAATLEAQAIEPILNPKELGLSIEELDQRTGKKASEVTAALAAYVRTIRSGDSPYDRYVAGQADALTDLEKRGMALLRGKARCNNCHSGPTFTDEQFHNTGITWEMAACSMKAVSPCPEELAITARSRHLRCERWPALLLTCTTAVWRGWKMSSISTQMAPLRILIWILKSALCI